MYIIFLLSFNYKLSLISFISFFFVFSAILALHFFHLYIFFSSTYISFEDIMSLCAICLRLTMPSGGSVMCGNLCHHNGSWFDCSPIDDKSAAGTKYDNSVIVCFVLVGWGREEQSWICIQVHNLTESRTAMSLNYEWFFII